MQPIDPIRFSVRFRYGRDEEAPDDPTPVLIYEYGYENVSGDRTIAFSAWNPAIGIASISPRSAVRAYDIAPHRGVILGPFADQLVVLRPGQRHAERRWYWPKRDLPFTNVACTQGYELRQDATLDLVFRVQLADDREAFERIGVRGVDLFVARLRSPTVRFAFRILMDDED